MSIYRYLIIIFYICTKEISKIVLYVLVFRYKKLRFYNGYFAVKKLELNVGSAEW